MFDLNVLDAVTLYAELQFPAPDGGLLAAHTSLPSTVDLWFFGNDSMSLQAAVQGITFGLLSLGPTAPNVDVGLRVVVTCPSSKTARATGRQGGASEEVCVVVCEADPKFVRHLPSAA